MACFMRQLTTQPVLQALTNDRENASYTTRGYFPTATVLPNFAPAPAPVIVAASNSGSNQGVQTATAGRR